MSNFDGKNLTTIKVKVKEFHWMNPHAEIVVDSTDEKGETSEWRLQLGPPNQLNRLSGLNKNSFKAGDELTISGNAYKDGSKIMRPRKIVYADGKEVPNL